jgi:hypothetical protein
MSGKVTVGESRKEFSTVMFAMCATFGVETTEAMLEGWYMAVKDLYLSDFQRAVSEAMKTCRFMPKPVDVRRLSGEAPVEDRAVVAWRAVMDAARRHGQYESVRFDDPIIHAAVRNIGGWERVCLLDADEADRFERRRFCDAYRAMFSLGMSEGDDRVLHLKGEFERNNEAGGWGVDPPIEVGTGLPPVRLLPKPPEQPRLELKEGKA